MGYKIVVLAKLVFLILFDWLDKYLMIDKIRDLVHANIRTHALSKTEIRTVKTIVILSGFQPCRTKL